MTAVSVQSFSDHSHDHNVPSLSVPDPQNAARGVCGLYNMGNTCFMNSGLQCLLCNPSIVQHLLTVYGADRHAPSPPPLDRDNSLTALFADVSQIC